MSLPSLIALLDERGWFLARDARAHGVSRDVIATLVARRQVERVRPQLYLRPGASREAPHRAALAVGGPGAVLGGTAAAWWHGLLPVAMPVVLVAVGRNLSSCSLIRFVRTRHLCARCVTTVRGARVVRLERAALDHAMGLRSWRDSVAFLTGVVQRGRTTGPRLTAMADHLGLAAARLRQLLHDISEGSRSAPEVDFIELVRGFGLPEPLRNVALACSDGITRYADLAYPDQGYYVEIDGRICHFGVDDWESDLARMNEISIICDLRPLRFTSRQIRERPDKVAAQLARALGVRLPSTSGRR